MSSEAAGPIALVTGGGRGIGATVAQRLAHDGMTVAVADVDEESARVVAAEIGQGAIGLRMDVSAEDSVAEGICSSRNDLGPSTGWRRAPVWSASTGSRPSHGASGSALSTSNAWGTYLCFRQVGERLRSLGVPGQMLAIASIAARGPNVWPRTTGRRKPPLSISCARPPWSTRLMPSPSMPSVRNHRDCHDP